MKPTHIVLYSSLVLQFFIVNIYGQSIESSANVKNEKIKRLSSGKWICTENKCKKPDTGNKMDIKSLETCHMLCPKKPPLWPKPRHVEILNKDSSTFMKEHIFLKIHSPDEIKSDVEMAANIFLGTLREPSSQYRLIEGENHMFKLSLHVRESNIKPSISTNESYTLYCQKFGKELLVNIYANTYFGVRHGLETLSQLIWYDDMSDSLRVLHDIEIVDEPKFNHRGLLIDVSRNYFPIYLLKKAIDGMAASKLNVLHLHVSDTESFPLELPNNKFLSENGAYNSELTYSSEEMEDLIKYARMRGIRTILEIDAPSHVSLAAFPKSQTLCGDIDIFKTTLNPDNPETFNTLQSIYQDLFLLGTDNETFHIGDDEVILDCWKNTNSGQEEYDLYKVWSTFTNKMMERVRVANNGTIPKNIVLWSSPLTDQYIEYLDYQSDLVVQYWYGRFNHIIDNGYKIIFSTVGRWYLDCGFGPWKKNDDRGSCDPYTGWKVFYKYRPWKDYANRIKQVLGGEVCLWSEEVSSDDLETRLWPRAAAFAERMWSDPAVFDQDDVFRRIDFHSRRLKQRGFGVAAIWPQICSQYPEKCDVNVKENVYENVYENGNENVNGNGNENGNGNVNGNDNENVNENVSSGSTKIGL